MVLSGLCGLNQQKNRESRGALGTLGICSAEAELLKNSFRAVAVRHPRAELSTDVNGFFVAMI